jgi:hypothetical protein
MVDGEGTWLCGDGGFICMYQGRLGMLLGVSYDVSSGIAFVCA